MTSFGKTQHHVGGETGLCGVVGLALWVDAIV